MKNSEWPHDGFWNQKPSTFSREDEPQGQRRRAGWITTRVYFSAREYTLNTEREQRPHLRLCELVNAHAGGQTSTRDPRMDRGRGGSSLPDEPRGPRPQPTPHAQAKQHHPVQDVLRPQYWTARMIHPVPGGFAQPSLAQFIQEAGALGFEFVNRKVHALLCYF